MPDLQICFSMAKVILEFDSFEDRDDLNLALNGSKYYCVLVGLMEHYRKLYKYSDNEEEIKEGEKGLATLNEMLNDHEIFL